VRHYDSVAGAPAADTTSENTAAATTAGKGKTTHAKAQTLNKDGSPRKSRMLSGASAATATKGGRKPGSTTAKPATGAKRGPKPRNQAALATDSSSAETTATPTPAAATPSRSTTKKPAAKPAAAKAAPKRAATPTAAPQPEASGLLNSADSASTGEVSE
jgi:hypothetical protein